MDYTFADERTGEARLMVFADFENCNEFSGMTLSDFISTRVDNFGNISVGKKADKKHQTLTKESLLKALDEIQKIDDSEINPSGMMFIYDLEKKLFGIQIMNKYDTSSGNLWFTDPYWFDEQGKIVKKTSSLSGQNTLAYHQNDINMDQQVV